MMSDAVFFSCFALNECSPRETKARAIVDSRALAKRSRVSNWERKTLKTRATADAVVLRRRVSAIRIW